MTALRSAPLRPLDARSELRRGRIPTVAFPGTERAVQLVTRHMKAGSKPRGFASLNIRRIEHWYDGQYRDMIIALQYQAWSRVDENRAESPQLQIRPEEPEPNLRCRESGRQC